MAKILLKFLNPLDNDTDCDDNINPASVEILTNPVNGTLSNFDAENGTYNYSPNEGFSGTDSIEYGVCDDRRTL